MKLNSLIDFLPYEYKDQDTYKVEGKGILERYLEIFGDYFQDVITSDIDNLLDIIDIDNTPGYYLNYLWEFLGELPFANTPQIPHKVWETYFAGFKDKSTIEQLCNKWLNNRTGVLEFDTDTVRKLLKCSIALFKIRGTKQFFEILFRLYGLGITITDPVSNNSDLWIPDSHPIFDVEESTYDKNSKYDNIYTCTQCVPVDIVISGHGFTSLTDQFFSFKKAIDSLFDRFLPYNVRPNITYSGITLDRNYQITAVPQNGTIITRGTIDDINILVTVTADTRYGDIDYRYQVSGDGVNWSNTTYDSPSIYIGKRVGTIYFRCVGDPDVVTSVTITEGDYIMAYNIWGVIDGDSYNDPVTVVLPTWEENQGILDVTVNGTLVGTIGSTRLNRNDLNIRIVETGEIIQSPARIQITKAGTYTFQLVDFPIRTWVLTVTAEEEFIIVAEPNRASWDADNPPSTVVTVTSKYHNPDDLTISLYSLNGNTPLGGNPYTFQAPSAGIYYFVCDQDPNQKKASFSVTGSGFNMIYPISVSFTNVNTNNVFDYGVPISIQGNIKVVWSLTPNGYNNNPESYDNQIQNEAVLEVLRYDSVIATIPITQDCQTSDPFFVFTESTYTITEPGSYQLKIKLNGITRFSTTYIVTQNGPESNLELYIVPYDESDDGWVNYDDPDEDYTSLTYKFDDNHPICRFYLERSDGVTGTAKLTKDNTSYHVGDDQDPIEFLKSDRPSGTYTFQLMDITDVITASLIIQKDPPAYTIQCDPPSAIMASGETSVSTTVKVTMTPEDTSGEFTYNINVPGLDVPVDAKNGYVFTTQATGDFTFTVTDTADTDNPVRCTFTVEATVSVTPEELQWDATDTQFQTLNIDLPAVQGWTAEISDTP